MTLQEEFGEIDIYLFDQLLRGRIQPGMRVLDAGCGGGRNLVYMFRQGHASYDVFGADADAGAIQHVQRLAALLAPSLPAANFVVAPVEQMPFPDAFADVVLSSAVLHFARNDAQFERMVREMWRVLKPGGMLWCRLASTIGMEDKVRPISGRWSSLPDGSERYLVDEALLTDLTYKLGGQLLDSIKTTVVSGQRAMTTWVARKL
jgi:ubiquinone/menaquinone biosynthesis C-methylase UbiE